MSARQCLGFSLEEFTGAEIYQMWAERMRQDWQHTAFIAAYICEVNRGKKGKPIRPTDLNPMEQGTKKSGGIKLNSVEGFAALSQVAKQWPRR